MEGRFQATSPPAGMTSVATSTTDPVQPRPFIWKRLLICADLLCLKTVTLVLPIDVRWSAKSTFLRQCPRFETVAIVQRFHDDSFTNERLRESVVRKFPALRGSAEGRQRRI